MTWLALKDQRDDRGMLTPLALALDAIDDNGCDCGTDEPGTCLACLCEAALKDLWTALDIGDVLMNASSSRLIVAEIIEDLSDRRGLGQEWGQIDPDTQRSIVERWENIVSGRKAP